MDALCLLDPSTLRIIGVNETWLRLFGYGRKEALTLTVDQLAVAPEDLMEKIRASSSPVHAAPGGGLWRRADRSQFIADFSVGSHAVGASSVLCVLIAELPVVDWSTNAPMVTTAEEPSLTTDSGVALRVRAAMRERVERSTRQQSALLRLASAEDKDFDELTRRILQVDAETLDVARVSYWTLTRSGTSIVLEALYDQRKKSFAPGGTELFARDYPQYFRSLVTGTLIPAHDACSDPATSELTPYLRPLGIGALLDIPVFLKGELVGVVCHEHVGPMRGWTLDEQQFALSIGQMFSLALAARQREDANRSLRQRDAALAEANASLDRALRPDAGAMTGRLVGPYKLGQVIGRGGMGEVYRATRVGDSMRGPSADGSPPGSFPAVGAEVAVKVLRPRSLERPEHVQRFFREARLTASVPSKHVARVLDVGTFDDGAPYIAMEMLEGHDLGWHLRRTPQLSLDLVIELVEQSALALAAVREAGVVHRDLKPSNLFLVDALPRAWKVLDFGLSRSTTDPYKTVADEIVGTPAYMAPEQICGDPVDHRTDLYALAAIAFRSLTGRPPFTGDVQGMLYAALTDPLPPIASLVRGVPVEVELVFTIALAKNPNDRFPGVEAFAEALKGAAEGRLDDKARSSGWRLLKRTSGSA